MGGSLHVWCQTLVLKVNCPEKGVGQLHVLFQCLIAAILSTPPIPQLHAKMNLDKFVKMPCRRGLHEVDGHTRQYDMRVHCALTLNGH